MQRDESLARQYESVSAEQETEPAGKETGPESTQRKPSAAEPGRKANDEQTKLAIRRHVDRLFWLFFNNSNEGGQSND